MAENTVKRETSPARTGEERALATRERARYLTPAVDIYEENDGLVVVADLPGLTRKDLDIQVQDGVLTIHGEMSRQADPDLVSREWELLEYFRQFTLSDRVDQEKIEASLDQGVLTLRLPRVEQAKPKRIEVKTK